MSAECGHHIERNLKDRNVPNYGSGAGPIPSPPIVFCIHGNKYGVARCCDDLPLQVSKTELTYGQEILQTRSVSEGPAPSPEGHCHPERNWNGMGDGARVDKVARRKLVAASALCLLFMTIEIVGGFMANSLALATDAAHLLTDFASFMISLFSLWVAGRPATQRMSFGWHRAEVIGATVSVLLIWVVTGVLVYMAVERVISRNFNLNATIMLITSGLGIVFNVIMGCSLHQHNHSHNASYSSPNAPAHNETFDVEGTEPLLPSRNTTSPLNSGSDNINVKAAYIHVVGDFIQSIGVFVAALIIYFKPSWIIIDPVCTFVFSLLVLFTTVRILRDTVNVLMEGIPKEVNFSVVRDTFLSVKGIKSIHNLRIWGLTIDKTALSAHLAIDPDASPKEVLQTASSRIRAKYNIYEMTLQVEEYNPQMDDCGQCQDVPKQ